MNKIRICKNSHSYQENSQQAIIDNTSEVHTMISSNIKLASSYIHRFPDLGKVHNNEHSFAKFSHSPYSLS